MIFINSYSFASTGGTPTITALNVLYDGTNITLKWAGNNLSGIPFLIQSSPGISQLIVVPNGRVGAGNTSYSITTGFTVGTTYNFTITPQGGGPFSTYCQIGTIDSQITQTQLSPTTKNIQFTTSNYSVGTTFTLYTQNSSSGIPPSYFINPSGWTSVGTCTIVSGGGGTFSAITIPATTNYLQIVGQASYSTVNSVTPYTIGSISLGTITQVTLSTVNISWTYSGYGGSESLQVYQSLDGTNYSAVGSSTTVNASPLNAFSGISAGNYVRLLVTSSLYGNASATSTNKWVYYSLPAPTVTQTTSTSATVAWTYVGYLGTDSLIVQQSADGSTGWAQVGSATTLNANNGIYSISNNYVRVQIVETGTTYPSPASSQFSYTLGTITGTSTQSQVTPTTKTIAFNTTIYPNGTTFKLYTQSGASMPTSYQTNSVGWTQLGSTTTITGNAGSFSGVTIPATVSSNPNYYQIVGGTTLYGTSYSTVTQVTAYLASSATFTSVTPSYATINVAFTTSNTSLGDTVTIYQALTSGGTPTAISGLTAVSLTSNNGSGNIICSPTSGYFIFLVVSSTKYGNFTSAAYSTAISYLSSNIVNWDFLQGSYSGGTVTDKANNYTSAIVNPSGITLTNYGLQWSSISSAIYCTIPSSAIGVAGASWGLSYELLFKPTAAYNGQTIIDLVAGGSHNNIYLSGNRIGFVNTTPTPDLSAYLALNTWIHLFISYSFTYPSTYSAIVYINNTNRWSGSVAQFSVGGTTFILNNYGLTGSYAELGEIAACRLYNGALSAAQVTTTYNEFKSRTVNGTANGYGLP
jgi:hypothetical protein